MRSYCRLKTGLAGFLLFYLVMAMVGSATSPNKEIFPFFSWFLFSAVPNTGYHYNVEILEHDRQTFSPAIAYNAADGIVLRPRDITAYQFIQKMGRTYDSGDKAAFEILSHEFQRNFLRGSNTYQLIKVYYNPVEAWHGKSGEPKVLETFKTGGAIP